MRNNFFKIHGTQFFLYFLSGCAALFVDYGSYLLFFEYFHVWYIASSVIGGVLGFVTVFFCNKYFVFRKKGNSFKHFIRFFIVDMGNIAVTAGILFILVDVFGIGEEVGKIIAMGSVVLWNFFIYKFFVYV